MEKRPLSESFPTVNIWYFALNLSISSGSKPHSHLAVRVLQQRVFGTHLRFYLDSTTTSTVLLVRSPNGTTPLLSPLIV